MYDQVKLTNLIIRYLFLALLGFWCFSILRPFFGIVLWGAILATSSYPLFLWLTNLLRGKEKLAAILLALIGIALIIGPVSYLATLLVSNAQDFAKQLSSGTLSIPNPPDNLSSWPVIGESLTQLWQSASSNLEGFLLRFSSQIQDLAGKLLVIAAGTGLGLLQFIGSIIVACIFIINTQAINEGLTRLILKLTPSQGESFLRLSASTIRGVTRGVIGVAVVQSLLIGIGLAIAQVPWAGLLTLICLVLAIIQLGPGLVVIPSIIWVWVGSGMNPLWAIVFTIWMGFSLIIDNFLKPMLMGRGLPVPTLVIFIGVIGGTLSGGILGLFIGPVVLSLGYELLTTWVNDHSEEKSEEVNREELENQE